jgi:hypothetical protein
MPGEHVLRRDVADGAVETHVVVMLHLTLSTRRLSRSEREASGMLHNVQVVTTVSTLLSSNGIASAEPSMKSTGMEAGRAARRAIERSFGEGSRPITDSAFRV